MLLRARVFEGQRSGLLGDVRMLGGRIHAKLPTKHLSTERSLRQHPVDSLLDHSFGMLLQHRAERRESSVAHVTGVTEVLFILRLATGDTHLRRVDHDHAVAGVHVRREDWLVLTANDLRDLSRKSAEHHPLGVDDEPLLCNVARPGAESPHCTDLASSLASPVRNATRVSAALLGVFWQT